MRDAALGTRRARLEAAGAHEEELTSSAASAPILPASSEAGLEAASFSVSMFADLTAMVSLLSRRMPKRPGGARKRTQRFR